MVKNTIPKRYNRYINLITGATDLESCLQGRFGNVRFNIEVMIRILYLDALVCIVFGIRT